MTSVTQIPPFPLLAGASLSTPTPHHTAECDDTGPTKDLLYPESLGVNNKANSRGFAKVISLLADVCGPFKKLQGEPSAVKRLWV